MSGVFLSFGSDFYNPGRIQDLISKNEKSEIKKQVNY